MSTYTKISPCIREELRKSKPITRTVERQLFDEYYSTSDEVRKQQIFDTIITSNLKFAFSVANKFAKDCIVELDDLYSAAKIGLIEAFHHYEKDSKIKFISFAVWYLERALYTAVSENDLIRIPIALKTSVTKKRKANDIDELNEREAMANNVIANLRVNPIADGDESEDDSRKNEIADVSSNGYSDIDVDNLKDVLWNMLKMTLSDNELYIIKYSFGLKDDIILSAKDIATNLHMKQSEFQKMKKGAYEKIQENDVLYGILKETVNA